MLTIGPRFGGAIDDAARYFKDAYDRVWLIAFSCETGYPTTVLTCAMLFLVTESYAL